jgi:uncharacterized membrane protein YfcA
MEYFTICLVALIGSGLTLFSGFGLGTLLVPSFALFFPIDVAIALTAIVHFLNNLFKLLLLGKHAEKTVLLGFGIPSVITAFLGAYLLGELGDVPNLFSYALVGKTFVVEPLKLTIAFLMLLFACFELIPKLSGLQFDKKYLSLGGVLSGFFGGLSGNQGALRSAFLMRLNLSKEAFIASGVAVACMVDVSRLSLYSRQIFNSDTALNYNLLSAATLSAFVGAYFGNKILKKITLASVHVAVSILLILFSLLLGMGIV